MAVAKDSKRIADLERALAEATRRRADDLRAFLRATPEAMLLADEEGRILEANDRAERMFGYGGGELAGRPLLELVPDCDRDDSPRNWSRNLLERADDRANGGADLYGRTRTGGEVPFELHVGRTEFDGKPVFLAALRDSTPYRRAEHDRQRLAAVLDSTPTAIQILGRNATIELWNPGAVELYGLPASAVLDRHAAEVLPPGTARHVAQVIDSLVRDDPVLGVDAVHERADGTSFDVSVTGAVVRASHGAIEGFCIMSTDMGRQRLAQQQIAEALDAERQRIGRELHDTLGQQITAMGLLLSTLKSESEAGAPRASTLANLEELVAQTRKQVRLLIRGVFPVAVDSAGLLWALYDLAHETSELYRIVCRVEHEPDVAVGDNFVATELFWIAREAVHNAVHHGRAREIVIELTGGPHVTLRVKDDGIGLPAHVDETRSMGLRTMRHRSSNIGAQLTIERGAAGGSVVTCDCGPSRRPRRVKRG